MIPISEFKQRRERLLAAVNESSHLRASRRRSVGLLSTESDAPNASSSGGLGVVLLQGAPKESIHGLFRQYNDFYYLCPVVTPHSYLVLDGRDGTSHLFLPYQSADRREREGGLLSASDPAGAREALGVDNVHPVDELATFLERVQLIYTPMRPGEGAVQSWDTLQRAQQERASDPWDGRPDRMRWFVRLLRERFPAAELEDVAPFLNELRLVKSPNEVDLLRRAGELSAKGLIEAMRVTRPGVFEYELDAAMRYVYLSHGARDVAYRAIVAGGDNAWYGHYTANDAQLEDGEMVLVDCGPDYRYYASDITRMWPTNGTYSAEQRELYGFMVEYHKALLERLRPGVTAEWVRDDAARYMSEHLDSMKFSKPIYEEAARRALEFPYHLSHPVGMAVHDVGHYRGQILRPGMVLSVDPQLIIPEERKYVRVEDTVAITEDGIENLTRVAPLELDAIEDLVGTGGLAGSCPRLWAD